MVRRGEEWSSGKGGGGGENGELCSLILYCIASTCEHCSKYICVGTCIHAV